MGLLLATLWMLDIGKSMPELKGEFLSGKKAVLPDAAKGKVAKPIGEFNEVRIVKRGTRVEHWLNGVKVVDEDLESTELKKLLKARTANSDDARALLERPIKQCPISLQHYGDVVWFRNIAIRRL